MTVLEASENLFQWFSNNDYFELNKNQKSINPISETIEQDRVAIMLALEDLEKAELVASKTLEDGSVCWVLKKPFTSFEQNVNITPPTAMALSQIINDACDHIGDDTDRCDPAMLEEKDIRTLIILYNHGQNLNIQE